MENFRYVYMKVRMSVRLAVCRCDVCNVILPNIGKNLKNNFFAASFLGVSFLNSFFFLYVCVAERAFLHFLNEFSSSA